MNKIASLGGLGAPEYILLGLVTVIAALTYIIVKVVVKAFRKGYSDDK